MNVCSAASVSYETHHFLAHIGLGKSTQCSVECDKKSLSLDMFRKFAIGKVRLKF